jgi:glycosyltransferase involved in cell wall biosynthesis
MDSVLAQDDISDHTIELIIIDDGSTDQTKSIVEHYRHESTFPLHYYYQSNQGVSSARNLGIKKSRYEWIAFLDSDDLWETDKLAVQIAFHEKYPHILFSHTDEIWIKNHKVLKQKKHHQKPQGFCFEENIDFCKISPSTVMLHQSIFEKIGYFDTTLEVCEDYDLWLRILKFYELGLIQEPLTFKISNSQPQLSFDTPMLDKYRIQALQKHIHSEFASCVSKEIEKKCDILIKGALKHNNPTLYEKYKSIKEHL